jgi:hypothetical protein
LKTIDIHSGIKKIDHFAFFGCKSLTEVVIPKQISTIPNGCFLDCKNLRKIILPNTITKIGWQAFRKCEALEEIELPDSLLELDDEFIFMGCKRLKKVKIPLKLRSIPTGMFSGCRSLEYINLPNNIEYIGNKAFFECVNLKKINISRNVEYIGPEAFRGCKRLKTIDLPVGVTEITLRMFAGCTNLTKVSNFSQIKKIGAGGFWNCKNLRQPDFMNSELEEIEDFAFQGCLLFKEIILPDTVETIGDEVFFKCRDLETFAFPMNLHGKHQSFSRLTFFRCPNLKTIFLNHKKLYRFSSEDIGKGKLAYIQYIGEFSETKDDLPFETTECAISCEPFNDKSQVVVLRCGHVFMKDNVIELMQFTHVCPSCRSRFY